MKMLLGVFFVPFSLSAQERVSQVAVGPYDNQLRVVAAFIETSEETFKMDSMIIDFTKIKNNQELPESVFVDLTSTVRTLGNGEKKQKILQLRWKKSGSLEIKCEGKWVKKESEPAADKIIEAVKSVIQNVPLNTKPATQTTLPEAVEQKIISVFGALKPETLPCLRVNN